MEHTLSNETSTSAACAPSTVVNLSKTCLLEDVPDECVPYRK